MRFSDDRSYRLRLTRVTLFFSALVLAAFGLSGVAKAGPVQLKLDHGQISLGIFKQDKILPATPKFPSDDLPTPQRTDVTLVGTETNGALSFPDSLNTGLQFPYMNVPHPTEDLKIPFTFRLAPPGLTGSYDAATGEAHIKGKFDIIVVTGTGTNFPLPDTLIDLGDPPLGVFARCRIAGVGLDLSTETKAPYTGQRFTGGFGVNGAMTASWTNVPEAVSENGGDCGLVTAVTTGKGAIWLSNGVAEPKPQPPLKQTCENNQDLCVTDISEFRLSPKKRKVKAGKRVTMKLQVTNTGKADAFDLPVQLKSSNKRVKVRKTLTFDRVLAGETVTETFKVRVKRKARGKAKIRATYGSLSAKSKLKIKKLRKRRG